MYPQIARRIFAGLLPALLTLVATSADANQSPNAVASVGGDPSTGNVLHSVTLYLGPSDTDKAFTISGAGSSDPDGDPLRYLWQCTDRDGNKCPLIPLTVVNVTDIRGQFPAGTYYLTLTVTDPGGASASDVARVKVEVDNTAPTVTPPDDESITATEGGGARGSSSAKLHDFLFNGATATDNSTAVFSHLPPRINGVDVDDNTLVPHGTTTVTFRIADAFGNVGTATAEVSITDHQSGDLFVGVQVAGPQWMKGAVQRIRGGAVTDFCVSPDAPPGPVQPGDPVYWGRPDQITVDSKGRVTFLAALNFGTTLQPSLQNGWGLLRCNRPGEPAEQLAIFPSTSVVDPGWPEPLPGKFFNAPGLPPVQPLTGLHLRKTKFIQIDDDVNDGAPQVITDERYVFAYHQSSISDGAGIIGNLSVNTNSLDWRDNDLSQVAVGPSPESLQNLLPEMFYHSKTELVSFLGLVPFAAPVAKTYATRFGTLRRIHQPLEVQLTAGGVHAGIQAFAGETEIPDPAGVGGIVTDDVQIPNQPSGCNSGARNDWPQRLGGYSTLQTDGVIYEENSGLVINSGFSMPSWAGHVDEALFDLDPQNDRMSNFAVPELNCLVRPVVNFTPLAGGAANPHGSSVADLTYDVDLTGWGFHPARMAASPNGLFGTQPGSPFTGVSTGRVVQATGARDLVEVATGLIAPKGLGAYPPQIGSVHISTLIIRIDSPVDVVLTDTLGRRVGVVDGQAINEFGSQAHDTGAESHPRLYIVRYPRPGNYTLRSVGNGTGPFTVHVYSVDSEQKVSEHISHTGAAQPGSTAMHDFAFTETAHIAFANAIPAAHAGSDQIADADASGHATFALDGSLSSDPDGDALTFTWAGPFGILSGARVNATLPAGDHVIKLTVDDGKGGTAEAMVHLTVNAVAPPDDPPPPACAQVTFTPTHGSALLTHVGVTLIDRQSGAVAATFDAAIGIPQSVPAGKYRLELTAPAGYEVTPEHRSLSVKCGHDRRIHLRIKAVPPPKGKKNGK